MPVFLNFVTTINYYYHIKFKNNFLFLDKGRKVLTIIDH